MQRKLAEFLLISFLSFSFFSSIFHAVANAQTDLKVSSPVVSVNAQPFPTPTVFSSPATTTQPTIISSPTVMPSNNPVFTPTPTLFTTQQQSQSIPTSTQQPTQTPTHPTAIPTPTVTIAVFPTFALTPTPTIVPTVIPTSTPTPTSQPEITNTTDISTLFDTFSKMYGADENELKKIAQCESGFNPNSNNSGLYLGMFQFAASSWSSSRASMGLDPNPDLRTNAQEAIQTAAYMLAHGEASAWPNCK